MSSDRRPTSSSDWGPEREPPWVLVVEDEQTVLQQLVQHVASITGMIIRPAEDKRAAITMLNEHVAPAVAVFDPTGDGQQLASQIRTLPFGSNTQLLYVLPPEEPEDPNIAERFQPYAVLGKPIDQLDLQDKLQDALEHWAEVSMTL